MRSMLQITLLITCLIVLIVPISHAAGDIAKGEIKADTCLGCHGVPSYTNVYPSYHVPKLGGQHEDYIVAALTAYQTGERSHTTMRAHAAGLSAEDMADIGAYFQALQ